MAGKKTSRKTAKKNPTWLRRLKLGLAVFTILFLATFLTLIVLFMGKIKEAEVALQKPEFQDRLETVSTPPTRIITADNVLLYRVSAQNRLPVDRLDDVPKHVRDAVMAAEDKRFYEHGSVDAWGLARAFYSVFQNGRVSQGGSTLTMQLAKLLYNGSEKSINRKVSDISYAYAMEEYKTKDQILLLYLNTVYFGEGAHGIKAAAKVYFDKDLKDLSIAEGAMLARCIQRPSDVNPVKSPKAALANRNLVLDIMDKEKMITDEEYQDALAEVPKLNKNPPLTTASRANFGQYFIEHVMATLKEDMPNLDLKTGGYTIVTTIDSKLQKRAEISVRDIVRQNNGRGVNQGCFVAMDREGRIKCEVGGVDFRKTQYNIVTQGSRQPGSAFKAIVYAVGLMTGSISGPDDYLSNAVINVPDRSRPGGVWSPRNASSRENAPGYSVQTAFKLSVNRPAMHLLESIGPELVVSYAHDLFGIKSKLWPGLPLAIGSSDVSPLEMLEAYSVFMTHGDRVTPNPISQIIGPDGVIVKKYEPQKALGVLPASVCGTMDVLMRAVVTSGTGTAALPVPNAKGKTGTTNDAKDAWFCGYTDGLVGVGWVGNQRKDGSQAGMGSSVYGGTVTAHIWAAIMNPAHDRFATPDEPQNFASNNDKPEEVVPAVQKVPDPKPDEVKVPVTDPIETDPVGGGTTIPDPENVPPITDKPPKEKVDPIPDKVPPITPPRRDPPTNPPNAGDEVIQVDICADSGQLATPYCPETVTRSFKRRNAPRKACTLHSPHD